MKLDSLWLCTMLLGIWTIASATPNCEGQAMTSPPYTIKTTIRPEKLHAGAPIELEIVLTNESSTTARIGQRSQVFDWQYELTREDRAPVQMTRYGEEGRRSAEGGAPGAVLLTLAPGQQLKAQIPLHQVFDLSAAGRYQLTVFRSLPAPGDGAWIEIRSKPMEFTLLD